MKISCPQCAAKYSIADEKVQDRLAKIRCRKCGTTIVIDGKSSPPNVYAADGASAPSAASHEAAAASAPAAAPPGGDAEYSVDFGDNDQRTMTVAALVDAYNNGEVTAETYVWTEGMVDWAPLGDVPEIVDALHAHAESVGAAPASEPAPAPVAQAPVEAAPVAAAPVAAAPVAAAPAVSATSTPSGANAAASLSASVSSPWGEHDASRAASRGGTRTPAADLFGGFDTAGSEEDVTTSAAQNAGPAAPMAPATGARNESSVLFSLSALTAAAPTTAARSNLSSPGPSSAATREDSGLIDLKALTSNASASEHPPAPAGLGAPLMAAPLGIAAPLGSGVEAQVAAAPAAKNRTGLYIGGGIAIAAIAIAGTLIATSKKPVQPAAQPSAAAVTPPAPTQSSSAAAAPQASVTAQPPATGTAEEASSAKPGEKKHATGHHYVWHGHAHKSSGSTTAAKTTPTKHVTHHHSACGCAPGNLECAMKCAAR